jgi:hypothetical protein
MLVTYTFPMAKKKKNKNEKKEKHKQRLVVSKYLEPYFSTKSPYTYLYNKMLFQVQYMCHALHSKSYFF